MAGAAIAAMVVGTGITVMGQMQAGKNANMIAQRNSEIQVRDADIAKQNAEFNAKIQEKQDDQRRREKRAKAGTTGVVVDEGTNLLAQAEQEFIDDLNAQLIRRGGKLQSQGLLAQAAVTSAAGTAAKTASQYAAAGTLMTGLGSAGSKYSQGKKSGLFG